MDAQQKLNSPAANMGAEGGYGNYGGYGGYGGYGSGGEGPLNRSLQDYLLILRERIWYILVVFLVVLSSTIVYTFSQTKLYQSMASLQIFRSDPKVLPNTTEIVNNDVRGQEDINTLVKILESGNIVQKVSERLTGDDLRQFMAPYEKQKDGVPITPVEVLTQNRIISPQVASLIIGIGYKHPDRFIAAKVANLFVDEFIAYNSRVRIDDSVKALEDLKIRADEQEHKVEELARDLQAYREKNNMISLDQRKDIVTDKLKTLNQYLAQTGAALKDASIRWDQVQSYKKQGKDLTDLSFISSQPLIGQLTQQISGYKITLAQLSERYKDKHPKMVEARNSLAQAERELAKAVDSAAALIKSQYDAAVSNEKEAENSLKQQESESMAIDRAAVDYETLERNYNINEQLLQHIIERMRETSMVSTLELPNARVVDRASAALETDYVSPKIALNIALGIVGGLVLGLAFALFIAFIDDRVKSSFDIESVIGLPLLGIIPQIRKMEQPDKAQIVMNNADRQVSEAFLTLHSSLQLRDDSKSARCLLVTSTIPGEGKSFTTTNLALTYASHGEKVLIIDCDLRKPNIHKSFRKENLKGIIDICVSGASIDDVLLKEVHPNLDVLPTGGRAKSPTQVLNSKAFELMLSDLRKRYDRIFIDTPPLAAVSDALVILPLVDGSLFTIFFNKVRRKAAQFSAKRLLEANVPVYGAILNGLNLAVSGYYYAQYYDKSYKDYYVIADRQDDSPQR